MIQPSRAAAAVVRFDTFEADLRTEELFRSGRRVRLPHQSFQILAMLLDRPAWSPVFVPLVYTGSVLALILASGTTSGLGVVVLAPLIWTALFHRPWESACVVAAIVAVEVIISLTPVIVPDDVTIRS